VTIDKIHAICQFWFKGIDDRTTIDKNKDPFKMWFMKNEKLDEGVKKHFEDDLEMAAEGKLKGWEDSVNGRLALVLLLDQFSRNIYRNTVKMFEYDEKALALSLLTVNDGEDLKLQLIERVFLYLPFEHSENIAMQKLSLKYFDTLIKESKRVNPANTAYYEYTFDYARRHYEIIERFGRFPHRNAILNRAITPEEAEFLKQPGSGF
jgi:uncharacterized protein (DUF924 family)